MGLKDLLQRTANAAKTATQRNASAQQGGKGDGWSDGWHTQASTGEALRVLRDSATDVAKSTAKTATKATQKTRDGGQQDGWSDGWHTQASTGEALRVLRDSATDVAKSTAKTTTTREGWRRIARGTGAVLGGAGIVAGGVTLKLLEAENQYEKPRHLKDGLLEYDLLENDRLEYDRLENECLGYRTYHR